MAQRITTTITSDLSENEGAETITFALHGATYEVDLTKDEQKDLENALGPFLGVARKASGSSTPRRSSPRSSSNGDGSGVDAKAVRVWAAQNDVQVSPRGRINGKVLEAYRAANS